MELLSDIYRLPVLLNNYLKDLADDPVDTFILRIIVCKVVGYFV